MVLENLYPLKLIEKSFFFAYLLGIGYAVVGIGAALIVFPEDPTLVSVAFIAFMMYPTILALLNESEETESKKIEPNIKHFFKDNQHLLKIYLLFFLGVFLVFAFFSMAMDSFATNYIFRNQVNILYGTGNVGNAIFNTPLFQTIFLNNLGVLVLCFISAFIFGDGGIFLIIWNASVWGTIFGVLAKSAAANTNKDPFLYFIIIITIVFTHMILEMASYVFSGAAGGILSKCFVKENKLISKKALNIFVNTMLLLLVGLLILFIAVSVETYVLQNSDLYRVIIEQSGL